MKETLLITENIFILQYIIVTVLYSTVTAPLPHNFHWMFPAPPLTPSCSEWSWVCFTSIHTWFHACFNINISFWVWSWAHFHICNSFRVSFHGFSELLLKCMILPSIVPFLTFLSAWLHNRPSYPSLQENDWISLNVWVILLFYGQQHYEIQTLKSFLGC